MTLFNATNLSNTVNFGEVVQVVNSDILQGGLGWVLLLMIFTVLFGISRHTSTENSLAYSLIGTFITSLFFVTLGIVEPYVLVLIILGLASVTVGKFIRN